ncbi:hypothetical protein DFH08DRAFT_1084649 [Mycena albidolilacea]|uniref:DOMON domain-containing protein n=1 Tax=Mycena albidolilacea TaxID=1033008 RepID=A0AAD7EJU0_9AGAR|nr:hypothetical protein DFH08DRAFT_1084649 [Mycena albidolilacea]
MFSLRTLITVLAVAALGSASSIGRSLNPAPEDIAHATPREHISARSMPATNARRFALGLPPLAPRRTRVRAPRAQPSAVAPTQTSCNIAVMSSNGTFGFINATWNGFGEYGLFQAEQAGSLEVTISSSGTTASELDLTATNSPDGTYPYFGALLGLASTSSDFGPASYAYLGGITQTPAGSPPLSTGDSSFTAATGTSAVIESAIWRYDPATQSISAQWINTDGSAPATHIVYVGDSNQALIITGSVESVQNVFGSPYPEVTFMCVPPL